MKVGFRRVQSVSERMVALTRARGAGKTRGGVTHTPEAVAGCGESQVAILEPAEADHPRDSLRCVFATP